MWRDFYKEIADKCVGGNREITRNNEVPSAPSFLQQRDAAYHDPTGQSGETWNCTPSPSCDQPGLLIGWTQVEARGQKAYSWNPCRSAFESWKESRKGGELVCRSRWRPCRKRCDLELSTLWMNCPISLPFVSYLSNTKETLVRTVSKTSHVN